LTYSDTEFTVSGVGYDVVYLISNIEQTRVTVPLASQDWTHSYYYAVNKDY